MALGLGILLTFVTACGAVLRWAIRTRLEGRSEGAMSLVLGSLAGGFIGLVVGLMIYVLRLEFPWLLDPLAEVHVGTGVLTSLSAASGITAFGFTLFVVVSLRWRRFETERNQRSRFVMPPVAAALASD